MRNNQQNGGLARRFQLKHRKGKALYRKLSFCDQGTILRDNKDSRNMLDSFVHQLRKLNFCHDGKSRCLEGASTGIFLNGEPGLVCAGKMKGRIHTNTGNLGRGTPEGMGSST